VRAWTIAPRSLRRAGAALSVVTALAATPACSLFGGGRGGEAAERPRDPAAEEATGGESASTGRPADVERVGVSAPGDRRTPAREDAGAGSPRRRASDRMVEEAKGFWIAGRVDDARARLQQAIRVDGSNGGAFLLAAEIAADEGEWDDAEGYHERAADLLAGRAGFGDRLDALARRIAARR
jgi:hypothetical protein